MRSLSRSLPLVCLLAACSHPAPPAATVLPTRSVGATAAVVNASAAGDELVGTVKARHVATIAPMVTGTVREVRVSLGSRVRRGDVLVRLAAQEIDAKLAQARAVYENAKLEHDRALTLQEAHAIPTAQVDSARARLTVAEAAQAEANAISAYTVLRAPFDGVVTAKSVDAGDTALPGQALLVVERPDTLRFEAPVPETNAAALTIGRRLDIRIDALAQPIVGTVAEISPTADPASRTVTIKLDLPPTAGLHSGRFGRLIVPTGAAHAVAVPASALVTRGQLDEVFVIAGDRARLRLVRTGRARDGVVELVAGVEAGELVATSDVAQLVDGQPVRVVR